MTFDLAEDVGELVPQNGGDHPAPTRPDRGARIGPDGEVPGA